MPNYSVDLINVQNTHFNDFIVRCDVEHLRDKLFSVLAYVIAIINSQSLSSYALFSFSLT